MLTAAAYDVHVEQLFDRLRQLHQILTVAGISYRIVGGLAIFIHVFERDPIRARLTADVDAAIQREDLSAVIAAASQVGWVHRRVVGVDMLVDAAQRKARSPIHLHFEDVPCWPPDTTGEGVSIAPVADLVRMKFTSYRLKDRVHIRDLDGVGLITPEIEAALPEALRQRLAEVRASE